MPLEEFKMCLGCGSRLPEELASLALRQLERKLCGSAACQKADDVRCGRVCCEQAEYTACVCTRSYRCPVHGEVHVGTHD